MMKKILFIFICVFVLVNSHANAEPCGSDTNGCQQHFYCKTVVDANENTTYTCAKCSDDTDNKYPFSAAGSAGITSCYRGCEVNDLPNSKRTGVATAKGEVHAPADDTQTPDTSQCKIDTCSTTSDICSEHGYHPDETNDVCVPNVQNDGCGTGELKFYINGQFSTCYKSQCPEETTLDPITICNGTQYGTACIPNKVSCSSALSAFASTCNGGITNDAEFTNGAYDFSHCTCKKTNVSSFTNGTADETCGFSADGQLLSGTGNCTIEIKTCNSGFCNRSGTQTCESIPQSFYSVGTDKACHSCPKGATSPGGSAANTPTACHYTSTTTFKDNSGGKFQIPVDNIKIKWDWQLGD